MLWVAPILIVAPFGIAMLIADARTRAVGWLALGGALLPFLINASYYYWDGGNATGPRHAAFTEEVKLEPFARALRETAPQVWFTALRATDTAVRAQMDPVSINPDGLVKVAPLLHWSSKDLYEYCQTHGLPNNFDYVDPTKGEENRECGLHLSH